MAFAAEIPCSSQSLGAGKGRSAEESSLGLSDPGPKLGLHRSIDLLGRSVKARPDQRAITHQEREQFSAGFCFTGMAFHHPVYQVNQAIGGVGRGGQGAFDSLFHQGIPRFLNRLNLSNNPPKPKIELFRIDHHRVVTVRARLLKCYVSIPKNRSGKSAGIARQDVPEVRIHDHAGSGQAPGL